MCFQGCCTLHGESLTSALLYMLSYVFNTVQHTCMLLLHTYELLQGVICGMIFVTMYTYVYYVWLGFLAGLENGWVSQWFSVVLFLHVYTLCTLYCVGTSETYKQCFMYGICVVGMGQYEKEGEKTWLCQFHLAMHVALQVAI